MSDGYAVGVLASDTVQVTGGEPAPAEPGQAHHLRMGQEFLRADTARRLHLRPRCGRCVAHSIADPPGMTTATATATATNDGRHAWERRQKSLEADTG